MSVSFISTQQCKGGWVVVVETASRLDYDIAMVATGYRLCPTGSHCFEDQKTAELAAGEIARLNHMLYVSDNRDLITVIAYGSERRDYSPVVFTQRGEVTGRGTSTGVGRAIKKAQRVAASGNLLFVPPGRCRGLILGEELQQQPDDLTIPEFPK